MQKQNRRNSNQNTPNQSNMVFLIGQIEGEIKGGIAVNKNRYAHFSLSTQDKFTNTKGEVTHVSDYARIMAWGSLAGKVCDSFQEGDQVKIKGTLKTNSTEDENGQPKSFTSVKLTSIERA